MKEINYLDIVSNEIVERFGTQLTAMNAIVAKRKQCKSEDEIFFLKLKDEKVARRWW